MKKKLKFISLLGLVPLLVACGRGNVTSHSTGLWDKLVYFFAKSIEVLSFEQSIGLGIILFTLVVRLVLLPLYNMQIKSSRQMQDIQPKLKALQAKYPGKDNESRMALAQESQALYKEHGINPYASMIPLLIQMPVMIALYQALIRAPFLKTGTFLWFELAKPDHLIILPILAAVFTFLSTWLTNKAASESNLMMTMMTYLMPVMIFFMGLGLASGVVLYWTVSNAFQVAQLMIFNNPFKIIAEREKVIAAEKERQAKMRRAKKKAKRQRN
ncbi:YidC/Oxa1 family membrane protein insertase [Streptococcus urinalis FB127-CNA-2]|uniref:Membrane protein insertase YidC n=1 Tax=Streptococcus urinalis 2285-97 TaxID=764291 RepID=G5KH92_9STRE|nr:YidC/Oxa1 family membrane protein insertase [Streptococcus urinalis]EHJ56394.1 60Kd inner membrane protein [Streptococcus urinalis 2285-97]EKS21074.1 YidC/Oxa1 family membrane protein insertase [Streptococcus urinalis FB127-CNA-2]VEF31083.1 membrane protein oxaA 1 precursor [Streptococcus urinalis]